MGGYPTELEDLEVFFAAEADLDLATSASAEIAAANANDNSVGAGADSFDEEDDTNDNSAGAGADSFDEEDDTRGAGFGGPEGANGFNTPIPKTSFHSYEEAERYLMKFATIAGSSFGIAKRSSRKGSDYFVCDRFRRSKTSSSETRKRLWRGCDCPWNAVIKATTSGTFVVYTNHDHHNHASSRSPAAHPCHCKRTLDASSKSIVRLRNLGLERHQIVSYIRDEVEEKGGNPMYIKPQNISNKLSVEKNNFCKRFSSIIDAVYQSIKMQRGRNYNSHVCSVACDKNNELNAFIWTSKLSVEYARAHSQVWCADGTHGTNKYGYPLYHIVGISSCKKTFTIAFALMRPNATKSNDYSFVFKQVSLWVFGTEVPPGTVIVIDRELASIAALETSFPKNPVILCRWHMLKAVSAKALRVFAEKRDEAMILFQAMMDAKNRDGTRRVWNKDGED